MSDYDRGLDPVDEHGAPPIPRSNGVATGAMICGIVGLLICWVPLLGFIVALVAVVLGVIGLTGQAAKAGVGKGAAVAGVATGGIALVLAIIVPLVLAMLLPALGRARTVANRTVSASNMTGTYKAMYVYAVTNKDKFPEKLGVLIADGSISPHQLVAPTDPRPMQPAPHYSDDIDTINAWVDANTSYIYVHPEAGANAPYDAIVMYERLDLNNGEGINILYGDGRVMFQRMPAALQDLQAAGIATPQGR